ncbi:MAG: YraN family protein [Patescibacteria group bacterium]|nr:YraN family protein [Patescibacteria group bacterium]
MKKLNYSKGKIGEQIAFEFLAKKGFKIIAQNWQNRFGEIDLIAIDKDILVFVEVKLKIGEDFGLPEEMIDPRKIYQIQRAAEIFLLNEASMAQEYPQYRLDAVCIILDKNKEVQDIRHYENLTE